MIKVEMSTSFTNPEKSKSYVETDISCFKGADAVEQAAIEIKGAMFHLMMDEFPKLVEKTKKSPAYVAETMCDVIGCDPAEFSEFIHTVVSGRIKPALFGS